MYEYFLKNLHKSTARLYNLYLKFQEKYWFHSGTIISGIALCDHRERLLIFNMILAGSTVNKCPKTIV